MTASFCLSALESQLASSSSSFPSSSSSSCSGQHLFSLNRSLYAEQQSVLTNLRATFPGMPVNRMCCCLCRTEHNTEETCSFLCSHSRKSWWFPARLQQKGPSLSGWWKQLFWTGSLKSWKWNKIITKYQRQLFLEWVYRKLHLRLFKTKPSVVKVLLLPSWKIAWDVYQKKHWN